MGNQQQSNYSPNQLVSAVVKDKMS